MNEKQKNKLKKEKITLSQWNNKLVEKTKSEIKNIVGRPPDQAYSQYWIYYDILWNPDSEKFIDLKVDFSSGSYVFDKCVIVRSGY